MISYWIFTYYSVVVYPAGHRLPQPPPDAPRQRDRATNCYATQQPFQVPPEKEGAPQPNSASGARPNVPSRGQLARSPGKAGIPGKGGVSIISGGIPSKKKKSSFVGFHLYGRRFFEGRTLSSPRGLFGHPHFLAQR